MVDVYLLDGTYELFRHFFAVPRRAGADGREGGALVATLGSVLRMFEDGCTHLGVATDHKIESFRNELWPGYKTGANVDEALLEQFEPFERALVAMGVTVWPMADYEADDAMASAAFLAVRDPLVSKVWICTPDKDLGQAVVGDRVVQFDRRLRTVRDAEGVRLKFGVAPASIPDYLALVGDSADGFPGLPGWGPKSAALVLARYEHLESIPIDPATWGVELPRLQPLSAVLRDQWELVLLFRQLATLRHDLALFDDVGALRWLGPTAEFAAVCTNLRAPELLTRSENVWDAVRLLP